MLGGAGMMDSEGRPEKRGNGRLDIRESETQLLLKNMALSATVEGITILDFTRPGKPLVYANAEFTRLTGYPVDSVIWRNCGFLKGLETKGNRHPDP